MRSIRIRSRSSSSLAPTIRNRSTDRRYSRSDCRCAAPPRDAEPLHARPPPLPERLVAQAVDKVVANAARKQNGVDSRIGELLPGDGRRDLAQVLFADADRAAEVRDAAGEDLRQDAGARHPPISSPPRRAAGSRRHVVENHAPMRVVDAQSSATSGPSSAADRPRLPPSRSIGPSRSSEKCAAT